MTQATPSGEIDSPISRIGSGLREKLERLTLARTLMVTALLTSAVIVNVNNVESFSDPTYISIWYLIIATYAATVVYAIFIRYIPDLIPLARVQFFGDALLVGGLVFLTGGSDSIFIFLFFLAIISAGNLLGQVGALFSASSCSLVFAIIVLSQRGFVPGLSTLSVLVGTSHSVPTYNAAINIIAFYAIAVLAGHLAERLGQVDSELERRRLDVVQLRALYEQVFHSINAGLCTLDNQGRIITFNRAAEKITGRTENELLGRPCSLHFPELAHELTAYRRMPKRYEQDKEIKMNTVDGRQLFLDISISTLKTALLGTNTGFTIHFTDLTAIRQLREFAQRQKQLAAIGGLAAAIAHEIRNPLASISGSIQLLDRQSGEHNTEQEQKLREIVLREVDRLNILVEDFLAYARPRPLKLAPVNLTQLIEETAHLVEQDEMFKPDYEVVLNLSAQALTISADEDSLRQIFWNLFRNAIEAMGDSGTLTVSAMTLYAGSKTEPFVEILVEDTGEGFTTDTLNHLFEPFFTTKQGGTGLGLATVHRIVESHSGMILAENSASGGAAFRVMMPVEPRQAGLDGSAL